MKRQTVLVVFGMAVAVLSFSGVARSDFGDIPVEIIIPGPPLDLVRANWGMTVAPGKHGDYTGDGVVNSDDLDLVRSNWGTAPPWAAAGDDDIIGDLGPMDPINSADLDLVRCNWGYKVQDGILDGDWNGDGVVSSADLDFVRAHWGEDAWQLLSGNVNAVPEPSVFAVLCAAMGLLAIRRR